MKLFDALCLTITLLTTVTAQAANPSFVVKVTGQGKPVILIPGLSSGGAVWDGTVAHLKDHYQCHVLTLAGFAGQPRIETPFLETVRNDLAGYIRSNKLDHPIIIGHSLGGFLTVWLNEKNPGLAGPSIIVDALPFLPASMNPQATAEMMKPTAEQIKSNMSASQEAFLTSSEAALKAMITKPADVDVAMEWVKKTDRVAAADAFYELFTTDLRDDLGKITVPTLALLTWVGYKDYTTREAVEAGGRKQYSGIKNCKVVMAETRHFIMLDDPQWFYGQVDGFLAGAAK